ncbi:hypothetical protein MMC24_006604 [Lignoscripta atroalba]|nr:hypothetical protein [Lignoscripta atroalba]
MLQCIKTLKLVCNLGVMHQVSNIDQQGLHPTSLDTLWGEVTAQAEFDSMDNFKQDERGLKPASWSGLANAPTKTRALLKSLHTTERGVKSVVFSFWTSTLDLIETALKHDSLGYVSIEGQVPEKKRATALKIFEQIPQSKSCCSLHLAVLLSRRLWELF